MYHCKWIELPGTLALQRYIATRPAEQTTAERKAELGARLGTTGAVVYSWLRGFRRPGPEFRGAIERICKIPADHWLTAAEYVRACRLRRAA